MARVPENSTSRSALAAAASLLALVEAATGADQHLTSGEALARVAAILRNVKGLREYQLEELGEFVELRLFGDAPLFTPGAYDPDTEDTAAARAERQRAAVDELTGQTTIDDFVVDPKAAADELAIRVRGTVTPPAEDADDA